MCRQLGRVEELGDVEGLGSGMVGEMGGLGE